MEEYVCKCGKSKVVINMVCEDLFNAEVENGKKIRDKSKGLEYYICNNCGKVITESDYFMMVDWDME